jgi:hypothetical protein
MNRRGFLRNIFTAIGAATVAPYLPAKVPVEVVPIVPPPLPSPAQKAPVCFGVGLDRGGNVGTGIAAPSSKFHASPVIHVGPKPAKPVSYLIKNRCCKNRLS